MSWSTLDYTALDGDRAAAEANLADMITAHAVGPGLFRLISLRHELPDAWARLTSPPPPAPEHVDFMLKDAHFPHLFRGRDVQLGATTLYLRPKPGIAVVPPAISLNGKGVSWNVAKSERALRPQFQLPLRRQLRARSRSRSRSRFSSSSSSSSSRSSSSSSSSSSRSRSRSRPLNR